MHRFISVFVLSIVCAQAIAADDVGECYRNATKKEQMRECLVLESKQVQAQYNSTLERVLTRARSFDRSHKKRQTAKEIQEANKNFLAYVKNECTFRGALKGAEVGETEVGLACRINLMRVRKSTLETEFLSDE